LFGQDLLEMRSDDSGNRGHFGKSFFFELRHHRAADDRGRTGGQNLFCPSTSSSTEWQEGRTDRAVSDVMILAFSFNGKHFLKGSSSTMGNSLPLDEIHGQKENCNNSQHLR
jgi:hypothetical protein